MRFKTNRALFMAALVLMAVLAVALVVSAEIALDFPADVDVTANQSGATSQFVIYIDFGEELTEGQEEQVWIKFPDGVNVTNLNPSTTTVEMQNSGILANFPPGRDNPTGLEFGDYPNGPDGVATKNVYTITVPKIGLHTGETTIVTFSMAASIHQPMEEGRYCVAVKTSDEMWRKGDDVPGGCWTVTGQPVKLFLKRQVPLADCGYKQLDAVASFSKIQDALDAAELIWNGEPLEQTGEMWPRWNMFDGCPSDLPMGENGVYVGAVIEVSADFDGNEVADVYPETLDIQVPGLIIGSYPSGTVMMAEINALNATAGTTDDPVAIGGTFGAVAIGYGGVTFGESSIGIDTDDFGAISETVDLYGFVVRDAVTDSSGIVVWPHEDDCDDVYVYSGTTKATGTLQVLETEAPLGLTVLLDVTDDVMLGEYDKIVDLKSGWSGYMDPGYDYSASFPGLYTTTLILTQPAVDMTKYLTATEFLMDGDKFAAFGRSTKYMCDDARVDIRGNEVTNMDWDGIGVYSASVWVDSNDVHDNGEDGFYGEELRPCGTLAVCDGDGEARAMSKLLELSNNAFHMNGMSPTPAIFEASGCWNTGAVETPYAGIDIASTVVCMHEYLTESDFLYIHDNDIYGNMDAGITLQEMAATAGNRILWNDITGNVLYGLYNDATYAERDGADFYEPAGVDEVDVIFRYNDVTENLWGVYNNAWTMDLSVYFNAKENFWNACEGNGGPASPLQDCPPGGPSRGPAPCRHELDRRYPVEETRPLGYGDAVDKGTFYNPWLAVEAFDFSDDFVCENNTKTFLDTLAYQHKRIYGSDSLQLQAGWNTLAVPLPLNTMYQTLGEMRTLGTFLEDAEHMKKYEVAYEYDNVNGDWDSATGPLKPVHGYLIKMLEPTRFPILYSEAWVYPSYSLTEDDPMDPNVNGWNFIGAAFGIDRDDDSKADPDQGRWAVADPDDSFFNETQSGYEEEAWKTADVALAGIIDYTGDKGLTSLFNPYVTGQLDKNWLVWQPNSCCVVASKGVNPLVGCCEGPKLWTGQAYWVHMADARALHGFESAPLFFEGSPPLPLR